ncbi:HopJ type III effector protein [Chryseobacterium sp.]|uniref:HopJ type III effector protein n=1 Tax=Chryseobacterium sp. TaxID=1871047 RepID=UPI00388D6361
MIEQVKNNPEEIEFKNVIAFIDEHYDFTPTRFKNGDIINEANQNNGSCKVFSFGKHQGMSEEEVLHLFGEFYRDDVLINPDGNDHQNIRNFMKTGWEGIAFEGDALKKK